MTKFKGLRKRLKRKRRRSRDTRLMREMLTQIIVNTALTHKMNKKRNLSPLKVQKTVIRTGSLPVTRSQIK
jgi:hypothetical protein